MISTCFWIFYNALSQNGIILVYICKQEKLAFSSPTNTFYQKYGNSLSYAIMVSFKLRASWKIQKHVLIIYVNLHQNYCFVKIRITILNICMWDLNFQADPGFLFGLQLDQIGSCHTCNKVQVTNSRCRSEVYQIEHQLAHSK